MKETGMNMAYVTCTFSTAEVVLIYKIKNTNFINLYQYNLMLLANLLVFSQKKQ